MLELRRFQIVSFVVFMSVQVTDARVISSADYPSYQAAVDAALPGDAVKFIGGDTDRKKDKNVRVSKTLRDVQFFDVKGNWDLGADVEGCLFFSYSGAMKQTSGRLRTSIFFQPSYGATFNLTHSDSVMFYYCETLVPMSNAPRISLVGFVRGVTIHKMVLRGETGTDPLVNWKVSFAPAVEIDATDPVGNGWGTYIINQANTLRWHKGYRYRCEWTASCRDRSTERKPASRNCVLSWIGLGADIQWHNQRSKKTHIRRFAD